MKSVDAAISVIQGYQDEWDSAINAYHKDIAAIDQEVKSDPDFDHEPSRRKVQSQLKTKQDQLTSQYNSKIRNLNSEAESAANSIRSAMDSVVSAEAVRAGRNAVGVALFGSDMPIADGAAEWEHAQEVAPQIASALQKAADSKEPLTEEQVKQLQAQWGDELKNPYYVQALMDYYRTKHSGESNATVNMLYRLSMNVAGSPDDFKSGSTRNSFLASLGTALVLSTGGTDASQGSLENSETYARVKGGLLGTNGKVTVSEIEAANISEFKDTGEELFERFPGSNAATHMHGYDVFTQLAGYAAAKNSDLTFGAGVYEGSEEDPSLATRIMAYDHANERGFNATRGGIADGATRFALIAYDESDKAADILAKDPMQALYMLSDTPVTLEKGNGPEMLQILEQNRLASLRDFLDSKTPFDVDLPGASDADGKVNVARYLTGNRVQGQNSFLGTVDGGEALGDMLADASAPAQPIESPANGASSEEMRANELAKADATRRASIFANILAGYQDGLDRDNGVAFGGNDKIEGEDVFGRNNPALRSWMGSIITPYVSDLADLMSNPTDSGTQVGYVDGEYGAIHTNLGLEMIRRIKGEGGLLEDLAYDKPQVVDGRDPNNPLDDVYKGGRQPALQAVQVASNNRYVDEAAQAFRNPDYDERMGAAKKATSKWTELIQELFDADADRKVAHGRAVSEANARARGIADFMVDVVGDVVTDKLPPGVSKVADKVIDAAKNGVEDSIWPTRKVTQEYQEHLNASTNSQDVMKNGLIRAMYESPYWTEREGHNPVFPGSQELAEKRLTFVNPDGTLKPYETLTPE